MRHLKHRHQLGRKKEHRIALMANLAAALFRHGRIQTTLPKAKALRPFAEKIITLAKEAQGAKPERALALRRQAMSKVRDKEAVGMLFNERATEFADRSGGYTRIYKLGTRIGDAAEMAVIQLIPAEDSGYEKKSRKSGSPAKAEAATPAAEETEEVVSGQEAPGSPEAVAEEPTAEAEVSTEEVQAEAPVGEAAAEEESEEPKKD